MNSLEIQTIPSRDFPMLLAEITDPPEKLYLAGNRDALFQKDHMYLSVVGSRRYTSYGKDACESLIRGLVSYPVVIVSGLALGIDGIAHKTALESGVRTIAVPGSGLSWDALYPQTHVPLARHIIEQGGALISEFEPDFRATPWSFPKRNRIMAGLSHATLVIEATEKSGTLITARLALEYNRDVGVVPGSIFSDASRGPNELLQHGATPITDAASLLTMLHLQSKTTETVERQDLSERERAVLDLLIEPLSKDTLMQALYMSASDAQVLFVQMELRGLIIDELGTIRKII